MEHSREHARLDRAPEGDRLFWVTGVLNTEGIFATYIDRGWDSISDVSTSPVGPAQNPAAAPSPGTPGGGPGGGGGGGVGVSFNIPNTTVARVPDSIALNGPRTDQPTGWGIRVRMGLLSDATYGVERYTSAGVRQVPTWS